MAKARIIRTHWPLRGKLHMQRINATRSKVLPLMLRAAGCHAGAALYATKAPQHVGWHTLPAGYNR